MGVGRTEGGKRVVVMRLDPDRRERLEGKEDAKDPNFAWGGGKDVEGLTRGVDSG